jgi:hypothetical protein
VKRPHISVLPPVQVSKQQHQLSIGNRQNPLAFRYILPAIEMFKTFLGMQLDGPQPKAQLFLGYSPTDTSEMGKPPAGGGTPPAAFKSAPQPSSALLGGKNA